MGASAYASVEGIDEIVVGTTSQIEIGGFPGTLLDVEVVGLGLLYEPVPAEDCNKPTTARSSRSVQ